MNAFMPQDRLHEAQVDAEASEFCGLVQSSYEYLGVVHLTNSIKEASVPLQNWLTGTEAEEALG